MFGCFSGCESSARHGCCDGASPAGSCKQSWFAQPRCCLGALAGKRGLNAQYVMGVVLSVQNHIRIGESRREGDAEQMEIGGRGLVGMVGIGQRLGMMI